MNQYSLMAALLLTGFLANAEASFPADGIIWKNNTEEQWLAWSGELRLDAGRFTKGKPLGSRNSVFLREFCVNFHGELSPDWAYQLGGSFNQDDKDWGDALIKYQGMPNTSVSLGRLAAPFTLGGPTANSDWSPFFESSLLFQAFSGGAGLGLKAKHAFSQGMVSLAAIRPFQEAGYSGTLYGHPRIKYALRTTLAPILEEGKVWHLGFSALTQKLRALDKTGSLLNDPTLSIKTKTEIQTRNIDDVLSLKNKIQGKKYSQAGLETGLLIGPLHAILEHARVWITRPCDQLQFYATSLELGYLLNKEGREYNVSEGNFEKIKGSAKDTWEVAARYSTIHLNNKNVQGGKGDSVTLALSYFFNSHLKISSNYTRGRFATVDQEPSSKQPLDLIGLRLQYTW